jgi:hypothetical protein
VGGYEFMRLMLLVEMDTSNTNQLVIDGKMGSVIEGILGKLKPEAAYFHARGGRRAITLVVDAPDGATLPSLAEPFWLELGATVEAVPVMNPEELGIGLGRLG